MSVRPADGWDQGGVTFGRKYQVNIGQSRLQTYRHTSQHKHTPPPIYITITLALMKYSGGKSSNTGTKKVTTCSSEVYTSAKCMR